MNKKNRMFLIFFIGIFAVISITKGISLVSENGCTDLLCRTIGSRLLHNGKSAYFFKWSDKDDRYFLNPNDQPDRKVNGNVVTPAVLQAFYPAARHPYPAVKSIWLALQYLFFFATIFFLAGKKQSLYKNSFFAVFAVLALYLCSKTWFYNVERGQVYVFYLLVLSSIYFLYRSNWKFGEFASGFVNGCCIFFRPLLIFFAAPFVLKRNWKVFAGNCCGFIVGLCFFVLPSIQQWKDYFLAMKEYSTEIIEGRHDFSSMKNIPAGFEGLTNMQKAQSFPCGGLSTMQYYLSNAGISLQPVVLTIIFVALAAVLCLFYLKKKPVRPTVENDFLFAFLLYMLSELFVVGYRAGYNQIEWIFVVFLITKQGNVPAPVFAALIAAVVLENVKFFQTPYQFALAEIILFGVLFFVTFVQSKDKKIFFEPIK